MLYSNKIIVVYVIFLPILIYFIDHIRCECETNTEESIVKKIKCLWSNLNEINAVSNKDIFTELEIELTTLPSILYDNTFNYPQILKLTARGAYVTELKPKALSNLIKIRYLDLSNNLIKKLPAKLFQNNIELRILKLYGNEIESLAENAFDGLPDLEEIYLNGNKLVRIGSVFKMLSQLKILQIEGNKIKELDEYAFSNNFNLRTLSFSGNELSDLNDRTFQLFTLVYQSTPTSRITELNLSLNRFKILKNNHFKLFHNLITLRIISNDIAMFESSDVFKSLKRLKFLSMGYNQIKHLPERLLFHQRQLEDISLKTNSIEHLPDKLFERTISLKKLYLEYNQIAYLSDTVFSTLRNLEVLWLEGNLLETVPSNVFKHLSNLKELNLARNKLESIEHNAFDNLKYLKKLALYQNQIKVFDSNILFKLTELISFSLSFNFLQEIKPGAFETEHVGSTDVSSRLIEVDLSWSNFSRIGKLDKRIFTPLTRVTVLKISRSGLKRLDIDSFKTMQALEHLEIVSNKIDELPSGIFDPLENLLKLDCSRNLLTHLDIDLLNNLISIEEVDFSGNRLITIPVGLLNAPSLQDANFNGNQIKYLLPETLENSFVEKLHVYFNRLIYLDLEFLRKSKLKFFSFGRNPWKCSCLDEIVDEAHRLNIDIRIEDYFDGENPVCVADTNKTCSYDSSKVEEYFGQYNKYKHTLQRGCLESSYCW